ncbi:MAG: hypothetical protein GY826_31780, partial [Fuerstiella sp.]|nr:hypothetical protein [Fuerstiella sp.]
IDHFELLPYVESETVYFEDIRLPLRTDALDDEIPTVEFPVHGVPHSHTSDLFTPMQIRLRSFHGNAFSGISTDSHRVHLIKTLPEQLNPNNASTITWISTGSAVFAHYTEFIIQADGVNLRNARGHVAASANGRWGAAGIDIRSVPLQTVHMVTLQLAPIIGKE